MTFLRQDVSGTEATERGGSQWDKIGRKPRDVELHPGIQPRKQAGLKGLIPGIFCISETHGEGQANRSWDSWKPYIINN